MKKSNTHCRPLRLNILNILLLQVPPHSVNILQTQKNLPLGPLSEDCVKIIFDSAGRGCDQSNESLLLQELWFPLGTVWEEESRKRVILPPVHQTYEHQTHVYQICEHQR